MFQLLNFFKSRTKCFVSCEKCFRLQTATVFCRIFFLVFITSSSIFWKSVSHQFAFFFFEKFLDDFINGVGIFFLIFLIIFTSQTFVFYIIIRIVEHYEYKEMKIITILVCFSNFSSLHNKLKCGKNSILARQFAVCLKG